MSGLPFLADRDPADETGPADTPVHPLRFPEQETPREAVGNALTVLMYEPASPDRDTWLAARLERALQLLDRALLREKAGIA